MEITPFQSDYLMDAAALFVQNFKMLRKAAPALPDGMENVEQVMQKLAFLSGICPGVMALDRGRLVGFMGWFLDDHFRGTSRKAAYCPEWGHAAVEGMKPEVYRAMYRYASAQWARAGCQVHAITLLAHDQPVEKTWFWNGFGLTVVDAVRAMKPLGDPMLTNLLICQAAPEDAQILSELDAEHWMHYSEPPIFMAPVEPWDMGQFTTFLSRPRNSVWLAMDGEMPVGFLRFDGYDFDGVAVVVSEKAVCISGAYVRPAYRGRKAAVLMLDSALRAYAAQGFECCALNFESFNPEAASFWLKYFEPVCLSVLRVPESVPLE